MSEIDKNLLDPVNVEGLAVRWSGRDIRLEYLGPEPNTTTEFPFLMLAISAAWYPVGISRVLNFG